MQGRGLDRLKEHQILTILGKPCFDSEPRIPNTIKVWLQISTNTLLIEQWHRPFKLKNGNRSELISFG